MSNNNEDYKLTDSKQILANPYENIVDIEFADNDVSQPVNNLLKSRINKSATLVFLDSILKSRSADNSSISLLANAFIPEIQLSKENNVVHLPKKILFTKKQNESRENMIHADKEKSINREKKSEMVTELRNSLLKCKQENYSKIEKKHLKKQTESLDEYNSSDSSSSINSDSSIHSKI